MRALATLMLVLAAVISSAADDSPSAGTSPGNSSARPRVDAVVPIPPTEHERVYYFGRPDHHLVPGTVTIDADPYICDAHRLRFKDRDDFVAHLRTAHGLPPEAIPEQLQVRDGRVHFVGK